MRTIKLSMFFVLCAGIVVFAGCTEELKIQNNAQRKKINELTANLATEKLAANQLARQLADINVVGKVEIETLQSKVTTLEEYLAKKNELIGMMQQQLTYGGMFIPPELGTALEDFANADGMVTYDSSRGIVKFESDLLFRSGSDEVVPDAKAAMVSLCKILNSEEGKKFDVIIAGHTDDVPIARPATRAKHPTNWHLSAHRAISVLNIMAANQVEPGRLSARGFGAYRPVVPNKPNKGGNPQNRRVEIYIVPKGM